MSATVEPPQRTAAHELADGAQLYVTWSKQDNGHMVASALWLRQQPGRAISSETLRSIPLRRLEAEANGVSVASAELGLKKAPKLHRPDGRDPDAFYRAVATHYRWHAALSSKPAALMAEAADVPVTTVHRWIREARRRGHLPKARRGVAG